MARIRSVHPGFFTDEDLVSVSMAARLLFIGLGVEADDKGVFEWKPLTLKMRIFPADSVDIPALLTELLSVGAIRQDTIDGRPLGSIRNFRRFQKPKTPNDIFPASAEMLAFVGLVSETGDGERKSFPPKGETLPLNGEKSPQMEDGGEDGEEEESPPTPPAGGAREYAFEGKVARLNRRDYDEFRSRFHAIPDFDAALAACDGWLSDQTEAKQRKWFGSVAPWLEKRHQEALARANPPREAAFSGPC